MTIEHCQLQLDDCVRKLGEADREIARLRKERHKIATEADRLRVLIDRTFHAVAAGADARRAVADLYILGVGKKD